MSANTIQVDYAQLDSIAQRFARQGEATVETARRLREHSARLNESWQGQGASAFRATMESELLPALARLAEALDGAQRTTREVSAHFRAAEEEAAALFRERATAEAPLSLPPWLELLWERALRSIEGQVGLAALNALWAFLVGMGHEFGEGYGPGAQAGAIVGDIASSFLIWGDIRDLIVQIFNGLHPDEEVEGLIVAFSIIGLAGDLGWLDAFIPDPVDGLNVAAATIKASIKLIEKLPEPIQESLVRLLKRGIITPERLPEMAALVELVTKQGNTPLGIATLDVLEFGARHPERFDEVYEAALWMSNHPNDAQQLLTHTTDPERLTRLGHLLSVERLPLPTHPPKPSNTYGYVVTDERAQHFLTGHTHEYLEATLRRNKPAYTTLWPVGTTPEQVSNYLQETLDYLSAKSTKLTPDQPVEVPLSNGMVVEIGVRWIYPTQPPVYEIGQFFPASGPGVATFSKGDMRIISSMPSYPEGN